MTEEPEKPAKKRAMILPPPVYRGKDKVYLKYDGDNDSDIKYPRIRDFLIGFFGNIIASAVYVLFFGVGTWYLMTVISILAIVLLFIHGHRFIGWGIITTLVVPIIGGVILYLLIFAYCRG